MNSSGWQFTPSGSSAIPIIKVKDWNLNKGISRVRDSADYDVFTTINVCDHQDPVITLSTLNAFSLVLVDPSVIGTLFGVVRDSFNGALTGGGAVSLTLTNASIMEDQGSGAHRQLAHKSLHFCSFSTDGVTSPLSIASV
jgi:hypothetical protein